MWLDYEAIAVLGTAALLFAAGAVAASALIGLKRPSKTKDEPYECGIRPESDARPRFPVKFYVTGMLFIVFGVEVVFFVPWAVIFREIEPRAFGLVEMGVFLLILAVGFIYVWKRGALDWEKTR
jgi:NADH-quinone oxidoreductase subunit A